MRSVRVYRRLAAVLALFVIAQNCAMVWAQSESEDELLQLVRSAASEIEDGDVDSAKQVLDKIAALDRVPADIEGLIVSLRATLADVTNRRQQAKNPPILLESESEQDLSSTMSQEELQQYLEELETAVKVLFDTEK